MTRLALVSLVSALVLGVGCGFDCRVQGETEHFNDCDALQSRYDSLSAETDAAARDDLLVCSEVSGCEVTQ